MPRYLCIFVQQQLEFRIPELVSVAKTVGVPISFTPPENFIHPYLWVDIPTEDGAKKIAQRSVMLKGIYEVYGEGSTYPELLESLKQNYDKLAPYAGEQYTFQFRMDVYGRSYRMEEQVEIFKRFADVPLMGKVDLKNPMVSYYIIEDIGENVPREIPPKRIYFARQIATSIRYLIDDYSLKTRQFIGTTSMSAELSFIVANMACIKKNSFVYDPFCGTGSLMVSAAHFGAHVLGSDLDPRVLRGDEKTGKKMKDNWEQYKLPKHTFVGIQRVDFAQFRHLYRQTEILDAIIADPPYGIRESTRKIGVRRPRPEGAVLPPEHIPQRINYEVSTMLQDLLEFGARMLRKGGRLCFWIGTTNEFKESDLPRNAAFVLIANSEQSLTQRLKRRLITMEKVMTFEEYDALPLEERVPPPPPLSSSSSPQQGKSDANEPAHDNLRNKLAGPKLTTRRIKRMEKKAAKRAAAAAKMESASSSTEATPGVPTAATDAPSAGSSSPITSPATAATEATSCQQQS